VPASTQCLHPLTGAGWTQLHLGQTEQLQLVGRVLALQG
jgi:hypothetical protein